MGAEPLAGGALEADLRRRFVVECDTVDLDGAVVELLRPRDAEELIDEEDFVRDERLPYWAALWPSAIVLAAELARHRPGGGTLLELGCGLGLVSIAAMRRGHRVVASDYYADALRFTRVNAWRALGREPETMLLDWRQLPVTLGRFERVVAADILYERPYAGVVAEVLERALAPGGLATIADPGRVAVESFLEEAAARGLELTGLEERPWQQGEIHQTIRLYSLRRP